MLDEAYDIEFKELFRAIIRRWYIILGLIIGVAAIFTCLKGGNIITYYETSTRIIVGNTVENEGNSYNINDLGLYQSYINTYMEMLKTDMVLNQTVELLSFNTSSVAIKNNISTVARDSTQFFDIYLTWHNREQSMELLTTLTDTFIKEMQKTYPGVNLRIMDEVKTPTIKVLGTSRRKTFVVGAAIGGMLSILVIFALEFLDNTVKGLHEVEERLKSYLLAEIPNQKKELREIYINKDIISDSYLLEAYRGLRTNLNFLNHKQKIKTIMVTSANPEEGKTTTAMMLGICMALSGKRTIVVEGNLRCPKIESLAQLPDHIGIVEALLRENSVDEIIQQAAIQNLYILSAGKMQIEMNASELLCQESFGEIIKYLENQYDFIFIDTPAMSVVSDAQSLTSYVDGIILVAKYRKTKYKDLEKAKYDMEHIDGNVLGVVVNQKEGCKKEKKYTLYRQQKEEKKRKEIGTEQEQTKQAEQIEQIEQAEQTEYMEDTYGQDVIEYLFTRQPIEKEDQ